MNLKEIIKREMTSRNEQVKKNLNYLSEVMPEVVTKTDEDGNTYQEALMEQMTSQQMEKYKLASDNFKESRLMQGMLLSYVMDNSGFNFGTGTSDNTDSLLENYLPYDGVDLNNKNKYIFVFGEDVLFDIDAYSNLNTVDDKKEFVYDIFNTALRKRFFANESDIREACSDLVYDEMNTDIVEPSVVTK